MKINLLLCDTFPGLLPPEIPSYASMFVNLFDSVSHDIEYEVLPAMSGILPTEIRHNEVYLITGCNRSVYEDEPWILNLLQWIREAAARRAFIVGICFGHQAIAQALGGKVEQYAGGWGVGIRESRILDEGFRKFFAEGTMHLLYNHHDQVLCLPDGACPLATSDFCRYEAFRIGNQILAFQGHPEYTPEYELHLLYNHSADEAEEVKQRAIQTIQQRQHEGQIVARYIIYAFIQSLTADFVEKTPQDD